MNNIIRKLENKEILTDQEREELIDFLKKPLTEELRKGQYSRDSRERMELGGGVCPACGK